MKLEELSKNTSASVRDHTSSDNIRSCNPGVFDSGATYRSSDLGWSRVHVVFSSDVQLFRRHVETGCDL